MESKSDSSSIFAVEMGSHAQPSSLDPKEPGSSSGTRGSMGSSTGSSSHKDPMTSGLGTSASTSTLASSRKPYELKREDSDDDVEIYLAKLDAISAKQNGARKKVQFSEKSRKLIEDSTLLLNSIPSSSRDSYGVPMGPRRKERSTSPEEYGGPMSAST